MSRRIRTLLALSAVVACGLMVAWFGCAGPPPPKDGELWNLGQALPDVDFGMPTLDLHDRRSKTATREEPLEELRRLERELATRADHGPFRCSLRLRTDGPIRHSLVVQVTNVSDRPAGIRFCSPNSAGVTFVFRDGRECVVGSFCVQWLASVVDFNPVPHVLAPTKRWECSHSLFSAAVLVCPPLEPGVYSVEAVFYDGLFSVLDAPKDGVYARSERVPFWVR